ncbi:LuxR C-terminal-related transcriptional regulator [Streptomyces sp. NBC_00005]|uniref:LuxR C-terminal-related transcriptional regulator n=1 Tax=Streptomyces sp. NBC_00005 TaxID=2903609 RepID=UPI003251F946
MSVPAPHDEAGGQDRSTVTVGIADHEILVRGGIRATLDRAEDIRVAGEACDAGAALALATCHQPNVLLIDGMMAGAQQARVVRTLRRLAPTTAVVVLATSLDGRHVDQLLRAGVDGCLLKSGNPQDIVAAVRVVTTGGAALGPEVAKRLLERVAEIDTDRVERARELIGGLTLREKEVLALVAEGMANNEIGRALYLSEGGVKAHISRLLTKLNCSNRVRAALIAHDAGLTGATMATPAWPRPAA